MGWDGLDRGFCELNKNGSVNRRKTIDHEFEVWGTTVVKSAMAGSTWYGVTREKDGRCMLVVCLTKMMGGDFLYKEITDTMGPYDTSCPDSILDLADKLCPCTDEYDPDGWAREWREDCRKANAIANSPTAFRNVEPWGQVLWHVPEDSRITHSTRGCLAGQSFVLTKENGRRKWLCYELNASIATKHVSPADCEPYVRPVGENGGVGMSSSVRDWYRDEYAGDPIWPSIDEDVTFQLVYECLRLGGDVYKTLGVGDSVVRERVFDKLAALKDVSYDTIYRMWLNAA